MTLANEVIQLSEKFLNLFKVEAKQKHVDAVWDILQKSYKPIGGIKGGGFSSKEDMIARIPFWKLGKKDGKIRAVVMYKDKAGRKRVAAGTDGTKEGSQLLKAIVIEDLKQQRSYSETSGPLLKFIKRALSPAEFEKYTIPFEQVQKIKAGSGDEIKYDSDIDDGRHYKRKVGGEWIGKVMLGTSGRDIK